jgi:GntR family transcriptional regulator of arabinose operon
MDTPKYLIVQEWIKSEINKGVYVDGDKLPSENELMERFGFSRQTIRLAISNLENSGYIEKVKGSGTYVRLRSLRNDGDAKSTDEHNVGVILRHLDYYIYPEVIRGIENTLMQYGYSMTLGITHNKTDRETAVLNSMMSKNLAGIIAEPTKTAIPIPVKDTYARLSADMPIVFLGGGYRDLNIPVVSMDYEAAAKQAVEYLIEKGHKNIGALLRSDEVGGHKRYEGYTRTLLEHGLRTDDRNVLWYSDDISDSILSAMFKQAYFSGMNRCTAILCQDDKIAEVLISNLKAINVKPFEDVSIISFDNSITAEMLGLTSMNHSKSVLGAKAVELLLKQIKTGTAQDVLLKSELVVRSSVHTHSFSSSWDSGEDLFEITD